MSSRELQQVRRKKSGTKPSPLRKGHPLRLKQKTEVNPVWASTPNITRKRELPVYSHLRRAQSENFLHSWDYSPVTEGSIMPIR